VKNRSVGGKGGEGGRIGVGKGGNGKNAAGGARGAKGDVGRRQRKKRHGARGGALTRWTVKKKVVLAGSGKKRGAFAFERRSVSEKKKKKAWNGRKKGRMGGVAYLWPALY